ncbi:MAG TPA: hypothetical protein VHX38_37065 [Pseudonocardiaceae bacterium]|jgi:hypothetical protein|nr:hypothetical protein [Pseudonocardiaceae bacterium]
MTQPSAPRSGSPGADGDAAYLDKTLLHRPVELYFDESVTTRTLVMLWIRATIFTGPVFFVCLIALLLSSMFGNTGDEAFSSDGTSSTSPLTILLIVALVGSFLIFWGILLLAKMQEPISEWHVLLADRAPAADSVYSQIVGRIRDRGLPLYPYARRTPTAFGPVSNRLVLVDGHYQAYITVFGYGSGLYLGWTMWRSRSGAHLVGRYLADIFRSMSGQLDSVALMLRTEQARAMREAVHAVCREGLHVAVERIEVPGSYGFPQGLPQVEIFPTASAPAPGLHSAPPPGLYPPPSPGQPPVDQPPPADQGWAKPSAGQ